MSVLLFSGKEGHPNIQSSTRPGVEPGTSGLGDRDLTTVPTPPLLHMLYTEFIKPGASMEPRHCGQDKRIFFCPVLKFLDSMLAPGFMNSVYAAPFLLSTIHQIHKYGRVD